MARPSGRPIAIAALLAGLWLALALGSGEAAATTTPNKCGKIIANGKEFAVRGHLTNCRRARRVSKRYLRHGIKPVGWSCVRYPADLTRIAFTCRKGGKDVFAIRR